MVDVEEENILKTIFKDQYPETWKENPAVAQCLRELSSYGLSRINKEPEILAEERSVILEQTQDLVFNNYKTFIQTAVCSRELFKDFNQVEQHLKAVSDHLPVFIENCQRFSKKSQEITSSRRLNSMTLSRHTQLLEILEMPQLMDTCVRNGYYDEALDLSSYVFHLEKKFSSIPIVNTLAHDVHDSLRLMLLQLIQQLRTNIQLPQCLKVISYLRRMDVFSEEELRIKFLQARDSWFQSILAAIPSDDSYQHITKVIEVSRVHLFDIMTQYRAIFSDDDPLLTACPKDVHRARAAIAQSWVFQKVSQFLGALECDLERETGSRLDSLLGQCMYFGLSFSRVGADFRGLLVPLFEGTALRCFRKSVVEAADRFQESMQCFVLTAQPAVAVSSVLSASTTAQDKLHPPLCLLEFTPLAELCNGILMSFNNLRLLAPVSLVRDLGLILDECLVYASKTIVDFNRTEESSFNAREREIFAKFSSAFAHELVPYVDRCFEALFPRQQLAHTVGVTLSEFECKWKTVGRINTDAILEPMLFLLPKPESDDIVRVNHIPASQTSPVSDVPTSVEASEIELPPSVVSDLPPVTDAAQDAMESSTDDTAVPETVSANPLGTESEVEHSNDDDLRVEYNESEQVS